MTATSSSPDSKSDPFGYSLAALEDLLKEADGRWVPLEEVVARLWPRLSKVGVSLWPQLHVFWEGEQRHTIKLRPNVWFETLIIANNLVATKRNQYEAKDLGYTRPEYRWKKQ
jgi:hypothetical protein